MAGEATLTQVNGLAKRVYDSTVHDLRPSISMLTERAGFEKGKRVGESYQVSIALVPPNGFTYAGNAATATGPTTLKSGRSMVIKQASAVPFEMDLREVVLWATYSRLQEQGEGAVAQYYTELLSALKMAAATRLEVSGYLGQYSGGLGTVDTAGVTDLGSNLATLLISQATWRPGLWWALGQGATIDSFTSTTKKNVSGALVLQSVDAVNRKITVQYSGALGTQSNAGDVLFPEGAWDGTTFFDMPGLISQGSNTSGTSLGISASSSGGFMNWKGNTKSISGNFTLDILEDLCGELRDRGASSRSKLSAYLANKNYGLVLAEVRAQRIVDSSYNSADQKIGNRGVVFESKEVGPIELNPYPLAAWGEVYIQVDPMTQRIGSSDISPTIPGTGGDGGIDLIKPSGTNNFESLMFSDQAFINKRPNHTYFVTGVTQT
jgi:hypothetical protein